MKDGFVPAPNAKIFLPFSAIVPPGSVSSLVAAKSFYQLLVLASTGDIEVEQREMSDEIMIALVGQHLCVLLNTRVLYVYYYIIMTARFLLG